MRRARLWNSSTASPGALLASLATDPATAHRRDLARRLWGELEADDGAAEPPYQEKLRPVLSDLVNGRDRKTRFSIGRESLRYANGGIQLKPGVILTDLQEAIELYDRAKALPDGTPRIEALRAAARMLDGDFLPGFRLPETALDWYDGHALQLSGWRYRVWKMLLETAERLHDPVNAAEAWRRLQGIEVPADDDSELRKPASASQLSRLGQSSGSGNSGDSGNSVRKTGSPKPRPRVRWADLLPHLEKQEANGFALSVREEGTLLESLTRCMARLSKPTATLLRHLSVFPQPFTRSQGDFLAGSAESGAGEQAVDRLLAEGLLQKVPVNLPETLGAATESRDAPEPRYRLPPFAQPLLWQTLSSRQKKRLRERHARYFVDFTGMERSEDSTDTRPFYRWFRNDQRNVMQALDVCLESPLTEQTAEFIECLEKGVSLVGSDETRLLRRTVLRRATPRLKESVEAGTPFPCLSAVLLLVAALEEPDFAGAIHWANVALRRLKFGEDDRATLAEEPNPLSTLRTVLEKLLLTTHHAGRHQEFDQTLQIASDLAAEILEEERFDQGRRLQFRSAIRAIAAENCWARGDLESALRFNDEAMADLNCVASRLQNAEAYFAASYYQRGCIQWARNRRDDALTAWNDALLGFQAVSDAHGIGDCKRQIGRTLAGMGQYAVGLHLIQESITVYAALENDASRASALGTLADVLVMHGKTDEARRYYGEGLDYWRSREHPQWINRFETALAALEPRAATQRAE